VYDTTSHETTADTHHLALDAEQHAYCLSRTFNLGPCQWLPAAERKRPPHRAASFCVDDATSRHVLHSIHSAGPATRPLSRRFRFESLSRCG